MPERIAACHICCDASVMSTTLMPGRLDVQARRQGEDGVRRGAGADDEDVGQLAVEQLLEQACGLARAAGPGAVR